MEWLKSSRTGRGKAEEVEEPLEGGWVSETSRDLGSACLTTMVSASSGASILLRSALELIHGEVLKGPRSATLLVR